MSLADIIMLVVLTACVFLAIRAMRKKKRRGGGCSCCDKNCK